VHHNISVQQDQQDALFAFSLLLLIASTCFRHLVAHHQEVLYIQLVHLCFTPTPLAATWHNTQNLTIAVYTVTPDDEQVSARNM
jgi:hypothetical protein